MRDILKAFRVGSFQGYIYAKPLPSGQFMDWIRDFKAEQKQTGRGDRN